MFCVSLYEENEVYECFLYAEIEVRHFSNRDYKNIPPQKISPLLPLETQHIISL